MTMRKSNANHFMVLGSEWVPSPVQVNSTGDVGFNADIESINRSVV